MSVLVELNVSLVLVFSAKGEVGRKTETSECECGLNRNGQTWEEETHPFKITVANERLCLASANSSIGLILKMHILQLQVAQRLYAIFQHSFAVYRQLPLFHLLSSIHRDRLCAIDDNAKIHRNWLKRFLSIRFRIFIFLLFEWFVFGSIESATTQF